jgi:hypothetical protein
MILLRCRIRSGRGPSQNSKDGSKAIEFGCGIQRDAGIGVVRRANDKQSFIKTRRRPMVRRSSLDFLRAWGTALVALNASELKAGCQNLWLAIGPDEWLVH